MTGPDLVLHGRTLEETFVYENQGLCGPGNALPAIQLPLDAAQMNQSIYELIRKSSFKKTEFALVVLSSDDWQVPVSIDDGLKWLADRFSGPLVEENIV